MREGSDREGGRNGGRFGAVLVGASAALQAPRWVRGRRFEQLLEKHDEGREAAHISERTDPAGGSNTSDAVFAASAPATALGVRVARALLRRLARLPFTPWRNTCLFRSIAECLVLRRYGVPAAIRLGVRRQEPAEAGRPSSASSAPSALSESAASIIAHAWVVYPGGAEVTTHVPLVPSSRRSP